MSGASIYGYPGLRPFITLVFMVLRGDLVDLRNLLVRRRIHSVFCLLFEANSSPFRPTFSVF